MKNLIAEIIKDTLCLTLFGFIIYQPNINNWWVIIPLIGLFSNYKYASTINEKT